MNKNNKDKREYPMPIAEEVARELGKATSIDDFYGKGENSFFRNKYPFSGGVHSQVMVATLPNRIRSAACLSNQTLDLNNFKFTHS